MSLGVMAGFALAYPFNVWMVARNLKHGLMTERKPGSRFELKTSRGAKKEGRRPDAHGGGHGMESDATVPQLAAMSGVTLFCLSPG
jgi:hypothetical protein